MCDFTERAVDRVAALGAAGRISPLGVDVFRWAYAQDANAVATLVGKVKQGGVGAWGQVPMPPQPQVKDADAQAIVRWIIGGAK